MEEGTLPLGRGLCLPQGLKPTEGLRSQAKQFRWARNATFSNLSLTELISLLCLAWLQELVLGHFRVSLRFTSGFRISSRRLQRAKVSGDEGSREAMHFWFVIWNMYIGLWPWFLPQGSWNPCNFLGDRSIFCSNDVMNPLWVGLVPGWELAPQRPSHDEKFGIFSPWSPHLRFSWER